MLEYTSVKSHQDLVGVGYTDIGIHLEGDEMMCRLKKTAEKDKIDMVVKELSAGSIYQLYIREK